MSLQGQFNSAAVPTIHIEHQLKLWLVQRIQGQRLAGPHALQRMTDVAITISTIIIIVYCCGFMSSSFSARNYSKATRLVTTGSLHTMTKTHCCLTTDDSLLDWKEVDCRACSNYAFCAKSDHQAGLRPLQAAKTWCKWCAPQVHTPEATAKLDVGAIV